MDDASFGIVLNEFLVLYHNGFDSLPPQLVQFSVIGYSILLIVVLDRERGSANSGQNLKDI